MRRPPAKGVTAPWLSSKKGLAGIRSRGSKVRLMPMPPSSGSLLPSLRLRGASQAPLAKTTCSTGRRPAVVSRALTLRPAQFEVIHLHPG